MIDLVEALRQASAPKELAFPEAEYMARLARVRGAMGAEGIDVLLVHHTPNICYLSGYLTQMTSWYVCLVVPREGEPFVHVNEIEAALVLIHGPIKEVMTIPWVRTGEAPEHLAEMLRQRELGDKRIGIEVGRYPMNVDTYLRLRRALPKANFQTASNLVLDLRAVKSRTELAHIREAARLTTIGMEAALSEIRPGNTDNDVAAAAYSTMVRAGSEHPSSPPVVQAGRRSSWGTGMTWKRFPLQLHEPVVVGLTGTYYRYAAPVYRTAVIGGPSDQLKQLADAALNVLTLLIENVRPGRSIHEVARAASGSVQRLPADVHFGGVFGYSVGVGLVPTWVEHSLRIVEGVERPLEPGMVFHSPIILGIPGNVGVGFSETWLVTDNGCDLLTKSGRELAVSPA